MLLRDVFAFSHELRAETLIRMAAYSHVTMARTSIQLDEETRKLLEKMKAEMSAASYAEVIRLLIRQAKSVDRGERGSLPKLEGFRREKIDRFD